MSEQKTVIIVDDHPLFRNGIKALLAVHPGFVFSGEAGRADEALLLVKKTEPDIILLDISLPDKDGIQLTREFRLISPHSKVVIVSMHTKVNYITSALKAGASGYICKESDAEKLLEALELIVEGEFYLDSAISGQVVRKIVGVPEHDTKFKEEPVKSLTPREHEIMTLLGSGQSAKDIAAQLNISPRTVETHRANIMNKLNIKSTMEFFRYAARMGIIDIDTE